jgi:uncharacterized cupredoxin-like copper-binding protein
VNGIRSVAGCMVLALSVLTFGACSSDSGKTVNVTAADFSLKPDVASVAAGSVKFKVKNSGGFGHEMVVAKVADAKDLPTKPNGEVDEDKISAAARIGEVENILPGQTKTVKLDLAAGKYVLFCNRNDGTKAVHFKEGMHVDFTVTAAK